MLLRLDHKQSEKIFDRKRTVDVQKVNKNKTSQASGANSVKNSESSFNDKFRVKPPPNAWTASVPVSH